MLALAALCEEYYQAEPGVAEPHMQGEFGCCRQAQLGRLRGWVIFVCRWDTGFNCI